MTRPLTRRRHDRGASGLEYGAVIAVGALVVAVLAYAVSGSFRANVEPALCRLFGGECKAQQPTARPLDWTKCNINDANRSMGFNAAFRGIRGDLAGKDQIVTQVNPATGEKSAQVTLTGKGGLGVETGDRTDVGKLGGLNDKLKAGKNGKIDVSAFAGMNTELGFRYDFNESEGGDPYGRAQRFLDTRRGPTWKRVLSGLGGTQGEALENGAATAVNGIRRGWNWLRGKDSPELDKEGLTPTAVTFRVGGEASAGGKWSGKKGLDDKDPGRPKADLGLDAGGEGKATAAGDVTIVVDDKKAPQNNGMRIFTQKFTADASGKIQGGIDLKRMLPSTWAGGPKTALEGGVGIAGTQTVIFDRNGNPVRFIIQLDKEWKGGGSVTLGGDRKENQGITGKGKSTVGHKTSDLYSLDLTQPENRAAFDRLFMTVGGMAAVPRIQHPEHLGQALDQYGRAFQRHGQLAHFEYDTSGNTIEGSGANGEKGIKRKGFGVGLNNEQTWAKYRSGRYFDNQAPQAGWQALANCPQG
ncbi:hypothetical protein SAMN04489713_103560 [Actinomadura madurae]|uniref:Uncharacterized protein n=1 Tax=Actinomadura madurae TaxID=1993 RepID=A0A1I5DAD6_9ACTN|nr:hypothetical protein SAMN04489713_103560 [Actinomadura madurae]SPT50402.1 Uncharacterised protein [Actinomadura madurae]